MVQNKVNDLSWLKVPEYTTGTSAYLLDRSTRNNWNNVLVFPLLHPVNQKLSGQITYSVPLIEDTFEGLSDYIDTDNKLIPSNKWDKLMEEFDNYACRNKGILDLKVYENDPKSDSKKTKMGLIFKADLLLADGCELTSLDTKITDIYDVIGIKPINNYYGLEGIFIPKDTDFQVKDDIRRVNIIPECTDDLDLSRTLHGTFYNLFDKDLKNRYPFIEVNNITPQNAYDPQDVAMSVKNAFSRSNRRLFGFPARREA